MAADNPSRLRVAPIPGADTGPVARLLADLPPQWHGDTIGPDIVDWTARNGRGRMTALRLHGLPERLRVELAWMAHWQYLDGVGVHVAGINQIAAVLADAKDMKRAVPGSLRDLDWDAASRMVSVWFEARHQRLPAPVSLRNLRPLFGYPRLALTARLHEGPWWEMDTWYPRCDPRIPLRDREPCGSVGCAPGAIAVPWLRNAAKWALAMMLQAGVLTWSTIRSDRIQRLLRFDRWLATLPDPVHVVGDLHRAGELAAAFRQWASDPANRASTLRGRPPTSNGANQDMRAVAQLMAFVLDNHEDYRRRFALHHGTPSPRDTRPCGHARSPANAQHGASMKPTTSMTTR